MQVLPKSHNSNITTTLALLLSVWYKYLYISCRSDQGDRLFVSATLNYLLVQLDSVVKLISVNVLKKEAVQLVYQKSTRVICLFPKIQNNLHSTEPSLLSLSSIGLIILISNTQLLFLLEFHKKNCIVEGFFCFFFFSPWLRFRKVGI